MLKIRSDWKISFESFIELIKRAYSIKLKKKDELIIKLIKRKQRKVNKNKMLSMDGYTPVVC